MTTHVDAWRGTPSEALTVGNRTIGLSSSPLDDAYGLLWWLPKPLDALDPSHTNP